MAGGKNKVFFDPTDVSADTIGSYAIGKAGDVITSVTIGADEHLHVAAAMFDGSGNAISSVGGALSVTSASNYAEDAAHVSGDIGNFILAVRQDTLASSTSATGDYGAIKQNALGEIYIKDSDVLAELQGGISVTQGTSPWVIGDGGGSITVDAVDLDIRDLAFATDSVDVSGSSVSITGTVAVTQSTSPWVIGDGGGSITVDAVDLDIRDLTAASDDVGAWLFDGTGNAISSTGGSLNVNVTNTVDLDETLANTAIENTAKSVTTTSAALLASQLASRKYLFVQNRGDHDMFVGKSGVTTANGFEISKRMWMEFRIGPAVSMHAVTAASTADARLMELS